MGKSRADSRIATPCWWSICRHRFALQKANSLVFIERPEAKIECSHSRSFD